MINQFSIYLASGSLLIIFCNGKEAWLLYHLYYITFYGVILWSHSMDNPLQVLPISESFFLFTHHWWDNPYLRMHRTLSYCDKPSLWINNKIQHNFINILDFKQCSAIRKSISHWSASHEFETCWCFNNFYFSENTQNVFHGQILYNLKISKLWLYF